MSHLAELARVNGMDIVSCAEEIDLRPFGIRPGKCVDNKVIADAFGVEVLKRKDPTQRKTCGCVVAGQYRHVRIVPLWLPVLLRHEEL